MTTVTRIIDLAHREANYKNILGTPTTEEYAEGLTLLQSLVDSLPGLVVGIRMTPWYIPRPQKVPTSPPTTRPPTATLGSTTRGRSCIRRQHATHVRRHHIRHVRLLPVSAAGRCDHGVRGRGP